MFIICLPFFLMVMNGHLAHNERINILGSLYVWIYLCVSTIKYLALHITTYKGSQWILQKPHGFSLGYDQLTIINLFFHNDF